VSGSALDLLASWLEMRQSALTEVGIRVTLTHGPEDRDPPAAWVDFETDSRSARLILWDNGLADLTVGDFVEGEVLLEEHREITSALGLDDVEATVTALMIDRP
jgi:hypothetical protein